MNKSARTVQGACMDLDKNMRSLDSNIKLELEEEREKRAKVKKSSVDLKDFSRACTVCCRGNIRLFLDGIVDVKHRIDRNS